jgi:CheY-like chemotaxis protein
LMKDSLLSEIGDSDRYNRLQMRRAIQTRGDPAAETFVGTAGELLRVLIVDDHCASADTLSKLVALWGHDVRRTYDGASGLALAATYQPDVLLLDLVMPNMSGLELARKVRKQVRSNDCFIVAITGRTDAGLRRQYEKAGIDLFLIKPVGPQILKTLLVWEFEYLLRSKQRTATNGNERQRTATNGNERQRTATNGNERRDLNWSIKAIRIGRREYLATFCKEPSPPK